MDNKRTAVKMEAGVAFKIVNIVGYSKTGRQKRYPRVKRKRENLLE